LKYYTEPSTQRISDHSKLRLVDRYDDVHIIRSATQNECKDCSSALKNLAKFQLLFSYQKTNLIFFAIKQQHFRFMLSFSVRQKCLF